MNSLLARFKALPRAARWLVIFVGGLVLPYFIIAEPALERASELSSRADLLQASLTRVAKRTGEADRAGQSLALGHARFGEVPFPGEAKQVEALNARIQSIIDERRISSWSTRARPPAALGREALAGVVPEGMQVQRVQVQLDFEASPEAAVGVIADLERSGEVYAITRASLRRLEKDGRKLVAATLTVETWFLTPKGARS